MGGVVQRVTDRESAQHPSPDRQLATGAHCLVSVRMRALDGYGPDRDCLHVVDPSRDCVGTGRRCR